MSIRHVATGWERIVWLFLVFGAGLWCSGCEEKSPSSAPENALAEAPSPTPIPTPTPIPGTPHEGQISNGDSFARALQGVGVPFEQVNLAVETLKSVDFPFTGLRPGQTFVARVTDEGQLTALDYQFNRLVRYELRREADKLVAKRLEVPTTIAVGTMGARIDSSVYNAILKNGGTDGLASLVSSLFAWDIDFSSDPRKGDSFRMIYEEKRLPDGALYQYGHLIAGEYDGEKTGKHQGFWFDADDDEFDGFYDELGQQLRRTFLRAPLDTMRVTSRFGYRRHPILGRRMMHHGVDYGAPVGTPVHAVADGRVLSAGYAGNAGKMIKLKHTGDIVTMYLHLSRISVKPRQYVHQGTVIGRVGATGRATGPHLDFRVQRHGQFVNPQTLKMYSEPAKKLPQKYRAQFEALMAELRPRLEAVEVPALDSEEEAGEVQATAAVPF